METGLGKAWAAGFFDGEGTISISTVMSRKSIYPSHSLTAHAGNSDQETLMALREEWGGYVNTVNTESQHLGKKPMWRWQIRGINALPFMEAIAPYSIGEKRLQILLGIQFLKGRTHMNSYGIDKEKEVRWREMHRQLLSWCKRRELLPSASSLSKV